MPSCSRPRPLEDRPELIAPGGKVDREKLFALYEAELGDDESPICVRFKLSRDLNKRVDRYLVDRIPFLSRTSLQHIIKEQAVTVKLRAAHQPVAATVRGLGGGRAEVVLGAPQAAIAPGQACVVYHGERVLGGGWIERPEVALAASIEGDAAAA